MDEDSREKEMTLRASFLELLKPLHQQWYLRNLLFSAEAGAPNKGSKYSGNPHFLDVLILYYNLVKIYASLDSRSGPLPILNMLSFTPGFIVKLWEYIEGHVFKQSAAILDAEEATRERISRNEDQNMVSKASGNKLMNVLTRITGKSSDSDGSRLRNDEIIPAHIFDDECEFWVVKSLKQGCHDASKEMQSVLFLFCSVYAHLLLVLDDIEFHDKQVFYCRLGIYTY